MTPLTSSENKLKLPPIAKSRSNSPRKGKAAASSDLSQLSSRSSGPTALPILNQQSEWEGGSKPGLITVRYGSNQSAILNSFCKNIHLLNYMKRISGCKNPECLDLMSWKSGEMQNICKKKLEYAYEQLKPRETYLLVKIVMTTGGAQSLPIYTSTLHGLTEINPLLADKLEVLSKPAKTLKLKNKWSSLSKKGMDPGKLDKKTGLASILSREKSSGQGKMGILGLIAAFKNKETNDLQTPSKAEKENGNGNGNGKAERQAGIKRMNMLPPIGH